MHEFVPSTAVHLPVAARISSDLETACQDGCQSLSSGRPQQRAAEVGSEVGSPPRRLWEPGCADLPELSFPQKDNGIYSVQLTDFMSAGSRAGMR